MEILHLSRMIPVQAAKWGEKTALRYRDYSDATWKPISWNTLARRVERAGKALISYNVLEKDRVGLFSQNCPECLITEYAIYANRAVCVPMYATSTTSQIEFIISHASISLLFVGDQYQYDRAVEVQKICKCLKQIVIFNPDVRLALTDVQSIYFSDFLQAGLLADNSEELNARKDRATGEDLANIMYTSGTTGEPKGVILTHDMFLEAMRVHILKINMVDENDVSMCFLPLTHIFEKAWTHFCLTIGIRVDINLNPADIQMTLKEVQPTCMCNVPRFWEKVYEGIQDRINGMPSLIRALFNKAIRTGRRYHIDCLRKQIRPGFILRLKYWFFDRLFFSTIRKTVGIQNGIIFPVAGARLSNDLSLFFRSIGCPIYYGYGLTESTATVSAFDEFNYRVGTVGTFVDGIEVRIGEENEILLKGKTITPGYYKNPEANAASFTADGFFRTGDAGALDGDCLVVTDRIKDLYKTSNGKYIAPQVIENALTEDRSIEMAAVIANEKKYVSALIVPAFDQLPEIAAKLGITSGSRTEWLQDERIHNFYEQRIHQIQKHMAGYEQIRRFTLLPTPFTLENGELTNTLKLKRKVVSEHYAAEIAAMY